MVQMPTLEEEWEKYVAPFIKEPGCVLRDPVVAACALTASRWMRAIDQGHFSRSDPEWHIKRYTERIRQEERERCAKIAERHAAAYNAHPLESCGAREIAYKIREQGNG